MENEIYTRSQDLIQKYLNFIKTIREDNESQHITIERLLELKTVLSNVNNVLTLIATLAATKKITDSLGYNEQDLSLIHICTIVGKQKQSTSAFQKGGLLGRVLY